MVFNISIYFFKTFQKAFFNISLDYHGEKLFKTFS